MKDKALNLALEALEVCEQHGYIPVRLTRESITAIKKALAQPEQEPVAWISHNAGLYHFKPDESLDPLPLYTTPPQRKPLTGEEIEKVWQKVESSDFRDCVHPFVRAIEAAHGIKENT
jgi:hypothetical protein